MAKLALLQQLRQMPTSPQKSKRDFSRYHRAPAAFIEEALGCTLTRGQREVAQSVRDYPVTIVQSANAVGKTHVAGALAVWFLRSFEGSKVVTGAAPPLENLERLLWGEIGARVRGNPEIFAGFKVNHLFIRGHEDWWLAGRTLPSGGTEAEREARFSGVHAPYLFFIIDEGDAVPHEVYRGIESCMSGGFVRLLIMFNPRAPVGPVYQKIRNQQAHVVTLDALEHPNVVTGRDVIPGAVTRAATVLRIDQWSRPAAPGEEVPEQSAEWFQVPDVLDGCTAQRANGTWTPPLVGGQWREVTNPALSYMVLARFPGQAENQLISRAWVEAAQARWLAYRDLYGGRPPEGVAPIHGQDVAEFGVDKNVACLRYGSWVAPFQSWNGVDILVTGDRAARLAYQHRARLSFVDATGVGSGVAPQMARHWAQAHDRLAMLDYDGRAISVKVGEGVSAVVDEGAFGCLRDLLHWRVREWLRTDPTAMLPPGEDLLDELCAPTYRVNDKGQIKVTDKETLRKLLKRSPDTFDALALTFADAPAPEQPAASAPGRVVHEVL